MESIGRSQTLPPSQAVDNNRLGCNMTGASDLESKIHFIKVHKTSNVEVTTLSSLLEVWCTGSLRGRVLYFPHRTRIRYREGASNRR